MPAAGTAAAPAAGTTAAPAAGEFQDVGPEYEKALRLQGQFWAGRTPRLNNPHR